MRSLLFLLAALPLCAQAKYMPMQGNAKSCPRVDEDEQNQLRNVTKLGTSSHSTSTRASAPGQALGVANVDNVGTTDPKDAMGWIPKGSRRDASAFVVYDAKGKATPLAESKGKVVVVNFWQTACEPSTNQLIEMADFQAKAEKFGFVALPVNMDSERWQKVKPFMDKNRKFFEKTQVYLPGLGEQGPRVFMEVIPALPALFIVDREGKIAYQATGYEPNDLGKVLQRALVEK